MTETKRPAIFLDRDGTLNIWRLDPTQPGAEPQRITPYADYDVKYPSAGPGRMPRTELEKYEVIRCP